MSSENREEETDATTAQSQGTLKSCRGKEAKLRNIKARLDEDNKPVRILDGVMKCQLTYPNDSPHWVVRSD